MSKIEKLLNKTSRSDDEAKKKSVIICVVIGLLLGACLFYGLFVVTLPLVKDHYNTLDICILYDFYDKRVGHNETAVYFIGNSIVGTATYAPLIDDEMMKRGYNITTYNCYIDGESPQMIALQTEAIIQSKPSLVIYGVSYSSFVSSGLIGEKLLFSKDRFTMSDELEKYYTAEELESMKEHQFDLRGYLGRVIFPTNTRTGNYDAKEPIGVKRRLNQDKTKDYDSIVETANGFNPVITNESYREKEAFIYTIQKLRDAGIPVIVINMPIHPLLYAKVPNETRQNYFDLLNSTGTQWIDMGCAYGDDHFRDHHHASFDGAKEFSLEMVDVIIQEVKNNVIHYA